MTTAHALTKYIKPFTQNPVYICMDIGLKYLLTLYDYLKHESMKKIFFLIIMAGVFLWTACDKDDEPSDRFRYLTTPIWLSDSLLVNGIDASIPGGLLEDFKGEVDFREDGTGTFGIYEGTWQFAQNETELLIRSDSLTILPLNTLYTKIDELESNSLKVTANFPNPYEPTGDPLRLRLTFVPK